MQNLGWLQQKKMLKTFITVGLLKGTLEELQKNSFDNVIIGIKEFFSMSNPDAIVKVIGTFRVAIGSNFSKRVDKGTCTISVQVIEALLDSIPELHYHVEWSRKSGNLTVNCPEEIDTFPV